MCDQSGSGKVELTKAEEIEYGHILKELSRLDAQLEKFTPLAALFLTAIFVYGYKDRSEAVFVAMPIVIQTAMQYVIANVYALFAMWITAYKFEMEHFGTSCRPKGFATQLVRFFKKSSITDYCLPVVLTAGMISVATLSFSICSMFYGLKFLSNSMQGYWSPLWYAYLIATIIFLLLPSLSIWAGAKKLIGMYTEVTNPKECCKPSSNEGPKNPELPPEK